MKFKVKEGVGDKIGDVRSKKKKKVESRTLVQNLEWTRDDVHRLYKHMGRG